MFENKAKFIARDEHQLTQSEASAIAPAAPPAPEKKPKADKAQPITSADEFWKRLGI